MSKKKTENLYWIGISLIGIAFLGWVIVVLTQVLGLASGQESIARAGLAFSLLLPVCGCLGMAILLFIVVVDRLDN